MGRKQGTNGKDIRKKWGGNKARERTREVQSSWKKRRGDVF